MLYSLLANSILLFHLIYILFVTLGGFLIIRWHWLWKLHIPAVIWGVAVQYFVWMCPLTTWENYFRDLSGEVGYSDGFINYYLTSMIYPEISAEFHTYIAIGLIIINLAIYFYIFRYKKSD